MLVNPLILLQALACGTRSQTSQTAEATTTTATDQPEVVSDTTQSSYTTVELNPVSEMTKPPIAGYQHPGCYANANLPCNNAHQR